MNATCQLAPWDLFSLVSQTLQDLLREESTTHKGLGPPMSIIKI